MQEAEASWDEAVASYRAIVLRAFAEVEDALAAQRLLAEQIEREAAAAAAARRQVEIAENRYRAGLIGFLPVATAQIAALERERAVARLRGEQFVASIALIKALGGDWRDARTALAVSVTGVH